MGPTRLSQVGLIKGLTSLFLKRWVGPRAQAQFDHVGSIEGPTSLLLITLCHLQTEFIMHANGYPGARAGFKKKKKMKAYLARGVKLLVVFLVMLGSLVCS